MKKIISFLMLSALVCSGCSTFLKSARQQRAYQKYVRKSSLARVKQQHRMWHFDKPQLPPASRVTDPIVASQAGPQAMSSGNE